MTSCQQLPSNGFFPNEALRHNIMLSSGVSFSSKPSLFSGNLSTESTKPPPTRNLRRSNQEYSFLSPKSKRQKQEPLQEWKFPVLPSCAVFRPTEEEFKDPMKYIASIKEEAKKYGICKIVPPSDKWLQGKKMMDIVDPKTFLFPTKVQNIHQLRTRNGPCSKFMEDLEAFLERRKTPLKHTPSTEGQEIDLYKLYKCVVYRGGMQQVSASKKWREIAQELRLPCDSATTVQALRNTYEKYLYAFEVCQRSKNPYVGGQDSPASPSLAKVKQKKQKPKESDESEEEFGYYDGQIFTLAKFRKMAIDFKRRWFPEEDKTDLRQIEETYWRLVETAEESVKVHYGSDVDVGTYGSGFPNLPEDLKQASGWNLNVFSTLPGSILQFLGEQVSGVTRPMMYVGMLFSSFCWHTEDNYLYSINYLHHGAPKTWYGIPAEAAAAFEAVMRKSVPELFNQTPNLLFLLITMISPRVLAENGVPVYTVNQNPGEFMITFPKGYHAGFNNGFNIAESSNFALADWFPYGRECLERYRFYGRSSVLSIEKLISSAALSKDGPRYIPTLQEELRLLRGREVFLREKVLMKEGTWKCIHLDHFTEERDAVLECDICKYDCYLSAVVCPCSPDKTCQCDPSRKYFLFRYKVFQIDDMIRMAGGKPIDFVDVDTHILKEQATKLLTVGRGRAGPRSRNTKTKTPGPRCLARRAGFHRLEGMCYEETSALLNDGMYIVESVADKRIVNGVTEYLLRWEGFPEYESKWIEESEFCCESLIDAYENKFRKEDIKPRRISPRANKSRKMGRIMMMLR